MDWKVTVRANSLEHPRSLFHTFTTKQSHWTCGYRVRRLLFVPHEAIKEIRIWKINHRLQRRCKAIRYMWLEIRLRDARRRPHPATVVQHFSTATIKRMANEQHPECCSGKAKTRKCFLWMSIKHDTDTLKRLEQANCGLMCVRPSVECMRIVIVGTRFMLRYNAQGGWMRVCW